MAKRINKRMKLALGLVDKALSYKMSDALAKFSEYSDTCKAKFDESVDVSFRLSVDPRHSDQMVRGSCAMPNGLGKTVRVAVFATGEKVKEALDAGADICGSDDLINKIKSGGSIDFDCCVATPDMMPSVGQVARILGPKGLMPNPKLGSVTNDVGDCVRRMKAGQVDYRVEAAGIVHGSIGKLSFSHDKLKENLIALYNSIQAAKPSGAKGAYFLSCHLSTTMGMAIKLDLDEFIG